MSKLKPKLLFDKIMTEIYLSRTTASANCLLEEKKEKKINTEKHTDENFPNEIEFTGKYCDELFKNRRKCTHFVGE